MPQGAIGDISDEELYILKPKRISAFFSLRDLLGTEVKTYTPERRILQRVRNE
jgi:hypothetical protein